MDIFNNATDPVDSDSTNDLTSLDDEDPRDDDDDDAMTVTDTDNDNTSFSSYTSVVDRVFVS